MEFDPIYVPSMSKIETKEGAAPGGHADHSAGHGHSEDTEQGSRVLDPVCGMTVDPHTTPHRHVHQHRTYYFCSTGCRTKFAADPARYLGKEFAPAAELPLDAIYTCPM